MGDGTQFTAEWTVRDARGIPFDVMLLSDVGPFAVVTEGAVLEVIVTDLRGEAPNEAEVIVGLYDPGGDMVHVGTVPWDERQITRLADLVDEIEPGTYTLELDVAAEPNRPRSVVTTAPLVVG